MNTEENERRGFFRVDDSVALSYRSIVSGEKNNKDSLQFAGDLPMSLGNELEKMRETSRIYLRQVEKESPEVARYLSHLEAKINLLGHHFMMGSDKLFVQSRQSVSISGSGIAFTAEEALNKGSEIEVKFILHPSLTTIKTIANVVSCVAKTGQYRVAVEYSGLSDEDRDLLIRHVVKKQMNDIRDQGGKA